MGSSGLSIKAHRELVSSRELEGNEWVSSGIGDLLHFQESAKRMETRYQVEHMSLAVLRVPHGRGRSVFEVERVRPLCGLLIRQEEEDVCWIYVAPHRYDHPLFQVR